MIPLSYSDIVLLGTVLLVVLLTIRGILLRKEVERTRAELVTVQQSLEAAGSEIEKLRQVEQRYQSFKADLNQAELATRMHKPRIEREGAHNHTPDLPERYRYIHSLAEKGISPSDIASILTISPREADQLVALASLRRT